MSDCCPGCGIGKVTEYLWRVKDSWYCSQECGAKAAYSATSSCPQPTSHARWPEIMASGG